MQPLHQPQPSNAPHEALPLRHAPCLVGLRWTLSACFRCWGLSDQVLPPYGMAPLPQSPPRTGPAEPCPVGLLGSPTSQLFSMAEAENDSIFTVSVTLALQYHRAWCSLKCPGHLPSSPARAARPLSCAARPPEADGPLAEVTGCKAGGPSPSGWVADVALLRQCPLTMRAACLLLPRLLATPGTPCSPVQREAPSHVRQGPIDSAIVRIVFHHGRDEGQHRRRGVGRASAEASLGPSPGTENLGTTEVKASPFHCVQLLLPIGVPVWGCLPEHTSQVSALQA